MLHEKRFGIWLAMTLCFTSSTNLSLTGVVATMNVTRRLHRIEIAVSNGNMKEVFRVRQVSIPMDADKQHRMNSWCLCSEKRRDQKAGQPAIRTIMRKDIHDMELKDALSSSSGWKCTLMSVFIKIIEIFVEPLIERLIEHFVELTYLYFRYLI